MSLRAFSYEARDILTGALHKGHYDAASKEEVCQQLLKENKIPVNVVERPVSTLLKSFRYHWAGEVKDSELSILFRQMGSLVAAGLPVLQALDNILRTTEHPKLKQVIKALIRQIEDGYSLSSSMQAWPTLFSPLAINLIKVGEATGRLDTVFLQLTSHYEYEQHTARTMKQATRYPIFVLIALAIAFLVLNVVVFPQFVSLFSQQNMTLPPLTLGLMALSTFLTTFWWVILATFVVSYGAIKRSLKTQSGQVKYDHYLIKLPIIGPLVYKGLIVRWCRTLAMMNNAGVPISFAITLSNQSINNTYLEKQLMPVVKDIEDGYPLSLALKNTNVMPVLVMQMVAIAEETGQLGTMLTESANFYQGEVEFDLKNLTSKIEPVLTVGLGAIVLVFALGIFMPIWGMLDFAG